MFLWTGNDGNVAQFNHPLPDRVKTDLAQDLGQLFLFHEEEKRFYFVAMSPEGEMYQTEIGLEQ